MQLVANVLLNSGVEYVGFVDFASLPVISDDGKLRANNVIGELVEVQHFWIEKPLRHMTVQTPRGPANAIIPALQLSATQPDEAKVFIRAADIVHIGAPNPQIEENYRQQFSKIALPQGAGILGVIPGGRQ